MSGSPRDADRSHIPAPAGTCQVSISGDFADRSAIRQGFTLVEILIVVVILGILSALIVPEFTQAAQQTKRAAFVSSLKSLSNAAEQFTVRTGQIVGDTNSGELPEDGFEDYIDKLAWVRTTPIGGVWDTEDGQLGVHFDGTGDTRDDDYMTLIDAMFDDGNLETGSFQKTGEGRYYYNLSSF
jgi:prepilin-type N-terminal cleavage/methylation domain-containing protein